jgi:hypothetical protein
MRSRTTQRKSWDSKRTQEAVGSVGAGKFIPSSEARHFGVHRTTLSRQLIYDAVPKGMGRKQNIPPETEHELVDLVS